MKGASNTQITFGRLLFCLACLWLNSLNASAAETRAPANANGANQAMFQRMLQETTAERDSLAVKVAELEKRLKESEKARQKAEDSLTVKAKSLDNFKGSNQNMVDSVNTLKTNLASLIEKFRETAQKLKETETDKQNLQAELEQKKAEINRHITNNTELYRISMDVLQKYQDKGVWAALVQQEPITQIKRAQIESISEQYRVNIEALKADDAKVAQR